MRASLALAAFSMLTVWWLTLASGAGAAGTPTALIFPPSFNATQSVAAASQLNAAIVDTGRLPSILIIIPRAPLSKRAIRQSGALFALRGDASVLCKPATQTAGI